MSPAVTVVSVRDVFVEVLDKVTGGSWSWAPFYSSLSAIMAKIGEGSPVTKMLLSLSGDGEADLLSFTCNNTVPALPWACPAERV